ncbi:MAG: PD-(D/E)XK nuclease family protein, partial [Firmicutes bacterium]|nr:PD-(D/E)XK nuclease family protein [Bacillota bacterium]
FIMQENYNKIVKNSDNNTKVIVQGIIDLVVVKDGKVCLIDYKTNRTKDEMYLKKTYALQLEIYKQAFEKATNTQVDKKYLYSFYLGKLIEID